MDYEAARTRCSENLKELCWSKIQKLFEIWKTVGVQNVEERADVVIQSVRSLFNEMIDEESDLRSNLGAEIEDLLKQAKELCRELGEAFNNVVRSEDCDLKLMDLKMVLTDRMEHLRSLRNQRIHEYQQLFEKETKLHQSIGIDKRARITGVPKPEELRDFSSYISQMQEQEVYQRQQFEEIKKKIETITSELELHPDTELHKMLISDSEICLSPENMNLLKELHHTLQQRLDAAVSEEIVLREHLTLLWERLKVENAERERISQLCNSKLKKKIDILKIEVLKYEEQKKQHIGVFIEATRQEISSLWRKCHYGELQKQAFSLCYSEIDTEEFLEVLEGELNKLKCYHRENIDILNLAEKRVTLWDRKLKLDGRSADPSRLFANRGGQLLKEEKERKTLEKELTIIDKKLVTLLDAYEKHHNGPFQFDDYNLKETIKSTHNIFQNKNEEEKSHLNKGKHQTPAEKMGYVTERRFLNSAKTSSATKQNGEKLSRSGTHIRTREAVEACSSDTEITRSTRIPRRLLEESDNSFSTDS